MQAVHNLILLHDMQAMTPTLSQLVSHGVENVGYVQLKMYKHYAEVLLVYACK